MAFLNIFPPPIFLMVYTLYLSTVEASLYQGPLQGSGLGNGPFSDPVPDTGHSRDLDSRRTLTAVFQRFG